MKKTVDFLNHLKITRKDRYMTKQYYNRVEYYMDGRLHRENGPAYETDSGNMSWYLNGIPHRDNGPAKIMENGHKEWWINGLLHRENGPAIEKADGTTEWWHNGEQILEKRSSEIENVAR